MVLQMHLNVLKNLLSTAISQIITKNKLFSKDIIKLSDIFLEQISKLNIMVVHNFILIKCQNLKRLIFTSIDFF